jgi:hypothetical protein
MKYEENARKIEKIIATAWIDEGFKQRLLSDPAANLKEQGVEIPPGVEVRIVEDTETVQHLVLPMKPSSQELSDQQLVGVAGGFCEERCATTKG